MSSEGENKRARSQNACRPASRATLGVFLHAASWLWIHELRSELWVQSLEERGRLWHEKNHQDQAAASRTSKAFRFLTTMSYMCMVLKLAKSWGKEMRSNVLELL